MSDDEEMNEQPFNFSFSDQQKRSLGYLRFYFVYDNIPKPTAQDEMNVYKRYIRQIAWKPGKELIDRFMEGDSILNYIWAMSKYTFPYLNEEEDWQYVSTRVLPRDHEFYNNLEDLEELVVQTGVFQFTNYLKDILECEKYYQFDQIIHLVKFLRENPTFIEAIPDAVFTVLTHFKRIVSTIPDEEMTEIEQAWLELASIVNLSSVTRERILIGMKWLAVMNANQVHAIIIAKMLSTDEKISTYPELDVTDLLKSLFEDSHQDVMVSRRILELFSDIEIEDISPALYERFFLYIKENPNTLADRFFTTRYINKLLNSGHINPNRAMLRNMDLNDVTQFSTDFEINFDFVKLLVRTQKRFSSDFFQNIYYTLEDLNPQLDDQSHRPLYEFAIRYFKSEVEKFINKIPDLQITFDMYITLRDSIPALKKHHELITKESIVDFLARIEPSPEVVEAWREMWAMQNIDEQAPPPPDWFIRQHDASNVHNKSVIKKTDCRLKLLRENWKNNAGITIDDIAQEIEDETRKIAEENFETEPFEDTVESREDARERYVSDNTVTTSELFKCRISPTDARYYGFGEIYQNRAAARLPPEERVELCRVLVEVWLEIRKAINQEEMYKTLVTQFTRMFKEHLNQDVCNQGWVGSLTAAFGAYVKELGYLCETEEEKREEKTELLVNKFLIDMRDDAEVKWQTIQKLFTQISEVLFNAKYDEEEWREPLEEMMRDAMDDTERQLIQNKIKSFEDKIKMYEILFEPEEEMTRDVRISTMIEFINKMKPTFFMDALTYFNEKQPLHPENGEVELEESDSITDIKKATLKAFLEFTEFQLKKI